MIKNRIRTYIREFDEHLQGGIPEGKVVLVAGAPGSMKSSLIYSILFHNAQEDGRKGLYISLEESRPSLLDQMENIGLQHAAVEDSLSVLDLGLIRKKLKMLGKKSWLALFKMYVENLKKTTDYSILAVDSLTVLETLARYRRHREEIFQLFEWFRDLGVTTFLTTEVKGDIETKYGEDYLADGIIHLKLEKVDDINMQRRIRCAKMRATHNSQNYYTLLVSDGWFTATKVIEEG